MGVRGPHALCIRTTSAQCRQRTADDVMALVQIGRVTIVRHVTVSIASLMNVFGAWDCVAGLGRPRQYWRRTAGYCYFDVAAALSCSRHAGDIFGKHLYSLSSSLPLPLSSSFALPLPALALFTNCVNSPSPSVTPWQVSLVLFRL